MIHVIASIELVEGRRDQFLDEFRKIVPLVREEQGCLDYGPTCDADTGIEAQADRRENMIVIVEKWESVEALKAHLVAPHMVEYRPKIKEMIASFHLQILEPV